MRYIGDWQTAAPDKGGVWHYVEPGSHAMHICMVMTFRELLHHRARRLIAGFVQGTTGIAIDTVDFKLLRQSATELGAIAELLDTAEPGELDELATNRSHNAQGAPALDDLVSVHELNRWWCSAAVEPENGPPGFDTAGGAIDPARYEP